MLVMVVLLLLNVALLVVCGMLFGKIDANKDVIEQQGKVLGEIRAIADEARQKSLVKFGVYNDPKKGLLGAFVNYDKPSKYKVVKLTPEDE